MGISGGKNLILSGSRINQKGILSYDGTGNPIWIPKLIGAVHANYRNSKLQIVTARTPLQIDGLLPSFNKMGWEVWDSAASKIHPQKADEIYRARINLKVSSSSSCVVTIELDLAGSILSQWRFQPMSLNEDFNSGLLQFYSGDRFVKEGATLFVDATNYIEIKETSMHLVREATETV